MASLLNRALVLFLRYYQVLSSFIPITRFTQYMSMLII